MSDPEQFFTDELEVLRTEAETGTQALFAYLSIHRVASDRKRAHRAINKTPHFWRTVLYSLQCTVFIVLGRVFDHTSDHNIFVLLKCAEKHPDIFTRPALAKRKTKNPSKPPEWLDQYLSRAYEPRPSDFRRLRQYMTRRSSKYHGAYRDIRRKVFAHKELARREDVDALFAKTQIGELKDMFVFLNRLHSCLWELFWNGRKPILRQQPHSVRKMIANHKPEWSSKKIQEHIAADTACVLKALEERKGPTTIKPLKSTTKKRAQAENIFGPKNKTQY